MENLDTPTNVTFSKSSDDNQLCQQYFAKYLTSLNLLELQLGDSNFRRYVLMQFLILFQYLQSPVKFKQENQKLDDEQTAWLIDNTSRIYRLLEDTPPDGAAFTIVVQHILKREESWNFWKNEGCPEFPICVNGCSNKPDATRDIKITSGTKTRRMKRSLGEQIREAIRRNKCMIGNSELNRLWNLNIDNMASCRSKDRDFLPTLETYFEEAIEQLDPSVESQYKRVNEANFGWRALRLLSRRSLHFFTHGNSPITRLPDYLEAHVKKLAKDIQSNAPSSFAKLEPTEDSTEVEHIEPENDPVTSTSEMEGTVDSTNIKSEEPCLDAEVAGRKHGLCNIKQLEILANRLGIRWKILAPRLGFRPDEIEYFESETNDVELQARKMFLIWLENDPDATPENLLYTLEGLNLSDIAGGLF